MYITDNTLLPVVTAFGVLWHKIRILILLMSFKRKKKIVSRDIQWACACIALDIAGR